MTQHTLLAVAVVAGLSTFGPSVASAASGDDGRVAFATNLVGYQETPATLNSPGSGEFAAKVNASGTAIDWVLTYRDLPTHVLQSHVHFGRPGLTGGIALFLCTNLGNGPAGTQACPDAPVGGNAVTLTGTLTAADVVPVAGQGIPAGAAGLAAMIEAMRNGAAYANVHTDQFRSGEIRGAIGKPHDRGDGHDD